MNRITILKALVQRLGYESYLEIGTHKGAAFNRIRCPRKVGVDPDPDSVATHYMTSDEYFARHDEIFDLIFIDGLHHKEQVMRDVEHSLNRLRANGTIVIHDVSPEREEMQRVPRNGAYEWTGDVWKTWVRLRKQGLHMWTLDVDHGVGLIRHGEGKRLHLEGPLTYERLDSNRTKWLNVVDSLDEVLNEAKV